MSKLVITPELRKAGQKWVRSMRFSGQLTGKLGKVESDGSITYDVPGKPQYVYVRIQQGNSISLTIAYNGSVAKAPVDVVLDKNRYGVLEVVGIDTAKIEQAQGTNIIQPGLGIGPHSHRIGFGLEDPVEARRFDPGLVYISSGLIVGVNPFAYRLNGIDYYFTASGSSGLIDLTSNLPTTAGYWAWVKVGLDHETQTLIAITGDEYPQTAALLESYLADISFGQYIPLTGIKLQTGQSTITSESSFLDIRSFLTGIGGDTGNIVTQPNEITTNEVISAGRNAVFFGPITITGSLTIDGRAIII